MLLSESTKNKLGHIFATVAGIAIPLSAAALGADTNDGLRLAAGAVIATTILGSLHIVAKADPGKCINFMCCSALSLGLFMDSSHVPEQQPVKAAAVISAIKPANVPAL